MSLELEYKNKIISLILALQPNAKIYLYGSRARNEERLGSDIDIALDAKEKIPLAQLGEIRDILQASNIPYKFDVVDLNAISNALRTVILKEGVLWTT